MKREYGEVSVLWRVCPAGGSHAVRAVNENHDTSCAQHFYFIWKFTG